MDTTGQPTGDDNMLGFTRLDLARLEEWVDTKAALWDGKESGVLEDIASCAQETKDAINQLLIKLIEMEELLDATPY